MTSDARALVPHLVVLAALLDGAVVTALGLYAYPGVLSFAVLFVLTVPALYALARYVQPTPPADPDADGA